MSGKSQSTETNSTTSSTNQYRAEDANKFNNLYDTLNTTYETRLNNPLNLNYSDTFSGTLDPVIQNAISRGTQGLYQRQAANDRRLATNLNVTGTGSNSALLNALQAQGKFASAGAANELYSSGLTAQKDFDVARKTIEQRDNQLRLADRAQSFQELAPGLNLLDTIRSFGSDRGTRTETTRSTQNQRQRGGILGLF